MKKEYNYATIRINEHFDSIKEGKGIIVNCNRFWTVTIENWHSKTSLRCDSTTACLKFIKENIKLLPSKRKLK